DPARRGVPAPLRRAERRGALPSLTRPSAGLSACTRARSPRLSMQGRPLPTPAQLDPGPAAHPAARHTDDVDPDEHRHLEEPAHDPVAMSREECEVAVGDALDEVPPQLMDLLDNVVFLVEDEPPDDDPDLLGVYDGVPLTERDDLFGAPMPDRITIFRGPTLRMCQDRDEVIDEVAVTVVHEIAHHFGIDDAKLHALGWG